MTTYWLRLDDGFPEHPKVIGLSDGAFRLHVSAMCYAHRNVTDGHIPARWPPPRLARHAPALVTARLWVPDPEGDGWIIHGYTDWQTSRADLQALSEQRSKAGRKGAAARWQRP
jgi:hypothetical protein